MEMKALRCTSTRIVLRKSTALTFLQHAHNPTCKGGMESKKDLLRETGKQVMQQLAEATAAVATPELTESSVPAQAVSLRAIQIEEVHGKERAQMFIAYYYVKAEGNCDLSRTSDPNHGEFESKNVRTKRPTVDVAAKFGKTPEEIAQYMDQCRSFRASHTRPHLDDKIHEFKAAAVLLFLKWLVKLQHRYRRSITFNTMRDNSDACYSTI